MQLRSFKVQGFKNFKRAVSLDDLGPINVIHGPNNVGKSNLLEAMELLFFVLGYQNESFGIPLQGMSFPIPAGDFRRFTLGARGLFNIESPSPIVMEAHITTTEQDLRRAGLWPPRTPVEHVVLKAELKWMGTYVHYDLVQFKTADGRDFNVGSRDLNENAFLSMFAMFLSRSVLIGGEPNPRFTRLGVRRFVNPTLAVALYDAKESPDLEIAHRWERFVEEMRSFEDILGPGKFIVTYDRTQNQANLLHQNPRARVPLQLLGSGIQQIAALLGHVLAHGSSIVGIEEPELNLRYALQQRLREMLGRIVGVQGGLDQIFICSHSDAFEAAPHFYLMEPTPDGPHVEKRPIDQARAVLGISDQAPLSNPNAVLCYLSTEGVVRVPERVMRLIDLPKGGGVVFLEQEGKRVEIMSNDTFADRFETKADGNGDEQA